MMAETEEKLSVSKQSSSGETLNGKLSDDNQDIESDKLSNQQASYRIRPQLREKFKPQVVKELIHNVLYDQLSTQKYNVDESNKLSSKIADTIRNKVKELKFEKYKYIVNVVVGEQRGAGVKMATRCLWDAEADSYAHGNFSNDSIFCVACVYAIFFY